MASNQIRLKEHEAVLLGLPVKPKTGDSYPRYRINDEDYNHILTLRSQNTDFRTTKKVYNGNGALISKTEKLLQKDLVDIPENHKIVRLSTNSSNGQQWVISQPEKDKGIPIEEFQNLLTDNIKEYTINRSEGSGISVYLLSDFHMGAYVGHLIKTPDFNFGIIESYFREIVDTINSHNNNEVYIGLLGDFIESFTGLNHRDSWKGLHKNAEGVKAIKLAHEILKKNIYTKINNLKWIGFVSGNHDRVTDMVEGDQFGGVAEMLQYLCQLEFKEIISEWNPILISKTIDNINYILTHGHLGIAKTEIAQIIFQYGKQGLYNVYAKGHKHTRETKKIYEKRLKYEKHEVVDYDTADYRAVTVPPLFTGNFYSESNGWTSQAGFVRFQNNGRNKLIFTDFTI